MQNKGIEIQSNQSMTRDLRRRIAFSLLSGLLSGLAATVFLVLLDQATRFREAHPALIWLLPLAGFFIGWIYHVYGRDVAGGNNLILDEIHSPQKITPLRMAPLILLGTLLTHLFGGSAGREGTAVQMGASLSDQLGRFFRLNPAERKLLLTAGCGAGFGAAIGAPWAGALFGMEVLHVGRFRLFAVAECVLASFTAYAVTLLLKAPHSQYPLFEIPAFDFQLALWLVPAGILFGLSARIFTGITHLWESWQRRWISYPPVKPFAGGLLLVLLFYWEGTYRFTGLGIPFIQQALQQPAGFELPLWKGVFTALTVGSGFKGGEFIPLVFIGATLGSALALWIPVSFQLLAATGFAAVFGAAANAPLACTLMAMEIFGWHIGPYALVACGISYLVSGRPGIYRSQR